MASSPIPRRTYRGGHKPPGFNNLRLVLVLFSQGTSTPKKIARVHSIAPEQSLYLPSPNSSLRYARLAGRSIYLSNPDPTGRLAYGRCLDRVANLKAPRGRVPLLGVG